LLDERLLSVVDRFKARFRLGISIARERVTAADAGCPADPRRRIGAPGSEALRRWLVTRRWLLSIAGAILFLVTGAPGLDAAGVDTAGGDAAGGDAAGVDAILGLEGQRIRAMVAVDLPTLDRILADDLTYVHSSGQLESKAEFLARLQSGDLKYRSMSRQDVKIRLVGCAAVVTGKADVDVESKGENLSFSLRFTDVYVHKDGRWQLIAWQSSRIR
jgi:hypothetical protein